MFSKSSSNLIKRFLPFRWPSTNIGAGAIASAFILMMLYACNSGDAPEVIESSTQPESDVAKEVKPNDDEESVYYMLPSALQIAHIFRKSGLKYYPDVTNDPGNWSKYISETSKLQNLGVYSADLCYVALNKQTQEELSCLKAMMDLSGDMGFSSVFSAAFVDRFERNIANEDSMIVILAQLQERLDFYLQDAEMEDKSTIIFSGAWVESIYISLAGYRVEGDETGLSVRVHEQLYILKGLISKLDAVWEPDEDVKTLISELKTLLVIVEGFSFMKDVAKKEHVDVSKLTISEMELKELMNKVDEIRAKIVNG
ncbi:MAG: hypothetical protein JKX74_01505 [Flavobacteriales bacterium]|nr:hypothetical protein [Flavobacteriales bacterium]